jgi:hypothetical protein
LWLQRLLSGGEPEGGGDGMRVDGRGSTFGGHAPFFR